MAGTWMSIVKGFGGMRVRDGQLHFKPFIPEKWKSYSFRIEFRGRVLRLKVGQQEVEAFLEYGEPLTIIVNDKPVHLETSVVLKEAV
jgi:maltose phosphorylase